MRNKYRVTFSKQGAVRFVGHLDLQTLFQRAIKRAGLPVAFSKGFNPHQLISFAQPLPLGMYGEAEIVEIELDRIVDTNIIVSSLNGALPDGFNVLSAEPMMEGEKAAAAMVNAAEYRVKFPYSAELSKKLDGVLTGIMSEDEIIMLKRTKKGMADADIRADIYSLENISAAGEITVKMVLAAGSSRSLKPELAAKLVCERAGIPFEQYKMQYTRVKLHLHDIWNK